MKTATVTKIQLWNRQSIQFTIALESEDDLAEYYSLEQLGSVILKSEISPGKWLITIADEETELKVGDQITDDKYGDAIINGGSQGAVPLETIDRVYGEQAGRALAEKMGKRYN